MAATVSGVTTSPPSGVAFTGVTVSFAVKLTSPVTVSGGKPLLILNDGGTATYSVPTTAAATDTLFFNTVFETGQNSPDLAVTGLNLNGATVTDAGGNVADLSGAVTNPPGVLAVRTTPPTVTSFVVSPSSGTLGVGQVVTFTIGTSDPVSPSTPNISMRLTDGGSATYVPGASTPTSLVFTTTIAGGQTAAHLNFAAYDSNVDFFSGRLSYFSTDGFVLDLYGAGADRPAPAVDGIPPTVTGVTVVPADGKLVQGDVATFTLATSEAVTVAGGPPTLSLNNGGIATFLPGSSTGTALRFAYTVTRGHDVADLAVTGLNLNGGSITDIAGNNAVLTGVAANPAGTLTVSQGTPLFAGLSVSGADMVGAFTFYGTPQAGAKGTYGILGGGSVGADGVTYSVTGNLAQINAALAAVTFTTTDPATAVTGVTATVPQSVFANPLSLSSSGPIGAVLTASGDRQTIRGGAGADTLAGGAAVSPVLVGGSGSNVLVGGQNATLLGGSGSSTFFLQAGGVVVGGGQRDVISVAGRSSFSAVFTAVGGHTVIGMAGPGVVASRGQDTVIGGAGQLTVSMSGADITFGGSAPTVVDPGGARTFGTVVQAGDGSTVVGGSGSTLVAVTGQGVLAFVGAGSMTFIGGPGSSTVAGGSGGGDVLFAQAGGGVLAGGSAGGNILVGGQKATTLFGGGAGDVLFAEGAAGTVLVAGAGNETLQGGGSAGADAFLLGAGDAVVGLGSGADVVFAGSGAATVVAGSGRDLFVFSQGQVGGSVSILGFKPGVDQISLFGYGAGEAARAAAAASISAPTPTQATATTVTLSDSTRITFQGVAGLPVNPFA